MVPSKPSEVYADGCVWQGFRRSCGKTTQPELGGAPAKPRFLDALRSRLRLLHYDRRTEEVYVDWTRRFILFHQKRHPAVMGAGEVEALLLCRP